MKTIDTPCPECDRIPVNLFEFFDGEIWFCPACGYKEISASVDIEAQLAALAEYDPHLATGWRESLGLEGPPARELHPRLKPASANNKEI